MKVGFPSSLNTIILFGLVCGIVALALALGAAQFLTVPRTEPVQAVYYADEPASAAQPTDAPALPAEVTEVNEGDHDLIVFTDMSYDMGIYSNGSFTFPSGRQTIAINDASIAAIYGTVATESLVEGDTIIGYLRSANGIWVTYPDGSQEYWQISSYEASFLGYNTVNGTIRLLVNGMELEFNWMGDFLFRDPR